jgi:hypothetical protein
MKTGEITDGAAQRGRNHKRRPEKIKTSRGVFNHRIHGIHGNEKDADVF